MQNLKTENISIRGKEKIEQKYKLKITYNGEINEKQTLEDVQLKIYSEQEKI